MMQFLKDGDGQLSSKRLFGLACFGVAVAALFMGRPVVEFSPFLAAAVTVFIAQAATGT